jgi:hypothetical protein
MTLRPAASWRNRFRHPFRLGTAVLVLLLAASPLPADIQQSKPGGREDKDKDKGGRQENIRRAAEIPTPREANVTVLRGVPTRIVLSATAALRQPVIFRLGDPPAHGTVSEPRASAEGNTKAVVTYTAGDGSAPEDFFTFRVRHRDTPTSGSATVRIRIVDPAAELIAPGELIFGEAVVGETAVRPIVLENRGTAAFAAPLRLDPPWRLLQETPDVYVAAGARVELRVGFTPLQPGEARSRLEFPGAGGVVTRLTGLAVAPLRLQPSLVQLAWDPATRSRQAVVTVDNRLEAPAEFSLAGSPRLRFSQERGTLPAKGSIDITVSVPLPEVADMQSMLSVVAHGVREEVPLTAPAAPPLLALREPEGWEREGDQVSLPAGAAEGALVFANDGGLPAPLLVTLPEGWSSPGLENAAALGSRETRRLLLVPPSVRPAPVTGALDVRLDEERLVLPLRAPATPPADPAVATGADALLSSTAATRGSEAGGGGRARGLTAQEEQRQFMVDTIGIFPGNMTFDRTLPELPAVSVGRLEPGRVPLFFTSAGSGYTYVVFREEYRPPPGGVRPTRHWLPIEGLKWKTTGNTVSTTLEGLLPGARVMYRFAVRAADGRVGQPSNPIAVTTPVPRPRRWPWYAAAAFLVAGGGWWWRRRRLA